MTTHAQSRGWLSKESSTRPVGGLPAAIATSSVTEPVAIGNGGLLVVQVGASDETLAWDEAANGLVSLPPPIFYPELAARLQIAMARPVPLQSELRVPGGLVIDLRARAVTVEGQAVELSAKEYALAVKLGREPARVWTKDALLQEIWGMRASDRTRTLDSHACRLRQKLSAAKPGGHGYVHNVWGIGYRMLTDLNT